MDGKLPEMVCGDGADNCSCPTLKVEDTGYVEGRVSWWWWTSDTAGRVGGKGMRIVVTAGKGGEEQLHRI